MNHSAFIKISIKTPFPLMHLTAFSNHTSQLRRKSLRRRPRYQAKIASQPEPRWSPALHSLSLSYGVRWLVMSDFQNDETTERRRKAPFRRAAAEDPFLRHYMARTTTHDDSTSANLGIAIIIAGRCVLFLCAPMTASVTHNRVSWSAWPVSELKWKDTNCLPRLQV